MQLAFLDAVGQRQEKLLKSRVRLKELLAWESVCREEVARDEVCEDKPSNDGSQFTFSGLQRKRPTDDALFVLHGILVAERPRLCQVLLSLKIVLLQEA